jgi:hypothetical protein
MAPQRLPRPVNEKVDRWAAHAKEDETSPAPGDLELVRSYLSLHDHEPGNPESIPPDSDTMRWWLVSKGLVRKSEIRERDVGWALEVRQALLAKVRENMGAPRDAAADRMLDRAVEESGLRVRFGGDDPPIDVRAPGVPGAIGRLLGLAFLARLDERWDRFRICGDPGCGSVFFDRSSNRTGKWCSMASCGNRNKVRAFRERQAAG